MIEFCNDIIAVMEDGKYLKKHNINAHKFKYDTLGKEARVKYYDIYLDKDGSLWLLRKGEKSFIPTYEDINYYK